MTHRNDDLVNELQGQIKQDEMVRLLARLEAHLAPEPSRNATEALLNRLRPLVPRPPRERFRKNGLTREPILMLLMHLFGQMRLFRTAWWLGSAALLIVGLLLAPELSHEGITLTAMAPPLVIAGMAYGFRSLRGSALELELSCPVTPGQVVLGRALVLALHCGVLGAVAMLLSGASSYLLLSWLSSLVLFTGLMLTLTLYTGTATAVVGALLLWAFQLPLARYGYTLFSGPTRPIWLPIQLGALALGVALLLPAVSGRRLYRLLERGNG